MFTGIIQEIGRLVDIVHQGTVARVRIDAPVTCEDAALGDSIAVNGTCLTVTALDGKRFTADVSSETLHRTTLETLRSGDAVNIEPALRPSDRMGGHIVSGHVDGVGILETIHEEGEFWRVAVRFPENLSAYIAEKGSLSIDGISLTVAGVEGTSAWFAVIPFTILNTNLREQRPGNPVNLEVDILARYVERLLTVGLSSHGTGLTREKLRQYGFTID